ncbi:tail fiber assembly protein [Citrobacter freundii complex sp. 2024EL-00237]|uniref:tail fiber assembly protein n=1 Tax=Citrobacter freundii complex sp. 2024EL-00237 TaxID=3374253 RepID=UPI003568F156
MMNADLAILENGIATTAGWIMIYNYSAVTGEYLDSNSEYIPAGAGLPALATDIEPPKKPDGQAVIWQGAWVLKDDWRGETVYSIRDGSASIVDYLGAIAEGYTQQKPATRFDKWDGAQWVTDTGAQHVAAIADAEREKLRLKAVADDEISWRQDAVDTGIATAEETAALSEWKKYRVLLMRIDTTKPVWPTPPGEQAS